MSRFACLAKLIAGVVLAGSLATTSAVAQHVQVEEFVLDNGMKFLLVPRSDQPNTIAAGWLAKVGSVNERPGITGLSHFFEHMMFKGTNTIGTRDARKDAELMAKQTEVHTRILNLVWTEQYERFRAGEIDDPWDPANDTPELNELRAELKRLMDEHKAIIVKNEFDSIYTRNGGSGMNAFTANDLTFYFINVPSNKFELWAWMESDRLANSVFREFYAERDVVHEERRLRTESTPTGVFEEQFDSLFWQSSPYHWPVIGWTSDLNSYTMEEAKRYYDIFYRPNNLVGVIVGDFDPAAAKGTIREYFSRLERGPVPPTPMVTLEMPQTAEKRFFAECDCQPQVEIRYHTVPFGHTDSYALEMMASILNGRTGRLYKSMVEGREIASSASASAGGLGAPAKYASFFSLNAEVKGDAIPEALEEAWYAELARLQKEPVEERELQKVKNQRAANAYRSLQSNFFLMLQLGLYESMVGWEYINESPAKFQAVTAADIQRVANTYFDWKNRSVATFVRKEGSGEAIDPELEGIPAELLPQIKQMVTQLLKQDDPDALHMIIGQLESRRGTIAGDPQAPPGADKAMDYVIAKIKAHLAEIEAAAKPDAPATADPK